jgi:hypothetical protein
MPPAKSLALSRVPTRFGTRFKTQDDQGGRDRPRIEHVRQTQRGEPRSRRTLANGGDDRDHSEPRRSYRRISSRFPDMVGTTALAVLKERVSSTGQIRGRGGGTEVIFQESCHRYL